MSITSQEQLFVVRAESKSTGEIVGLKVWGVDCTAATHSLSHAMFGASGEYRWLGTGPARDVDGECVFRMVGA